MRIVLSSYLPTGRAFNLAQCIFSINIFQKFKYGIFLIDLLKMVVYSAIHFFEVIRMPNQQEYLDEFIKIQKDFKNIAKKKLTLKLQLRKDPNKIKFTASKEII